jgi:hypothetical protein
MVSQYAAIGRFWQLLSGREIQADWPGLQRRQGR